MKSSLSSKSSSPRHGHRRSDRPRGMFELNLIQTAVRHILSGDCDVISTIRFEAVYRATYQLVSRDQGRLVYQGISDIFADYLENLKLKLKVEDVDQVATEMIDNFVLALATISDLLMYLDRTFAVPNEMLPIFDLGISLLNKSILADTSLPSYCGTRTVTAAS